MMKHCPGEFLNIIIGPNGTGKSTIVAAIILGMGGNCKILSRSKDITDFIKNGKTKSVIEVELYGGNEDEDVTFHRSFDKDGKEEFKVTKKIIILFQILKTIPFRSMAKKFRTENIFEKLRISMFRSIICVNFYRKIVCKISQK